jgi:hypothetical protein
VKTSNVCEVLRAKHFAKSCICLSHHILTIPKMHYCSHLANEETEVLEKLINLCG